MNDLNECCENTLNKFVKASYNNFPEETKRTFEALIKSNNPLPVINLTYEAKVDRVRVNASLAALEALQLVTCTVSGVSKLYQTTEFGDEFAENILRIK